MRSPYFSDVVIALRYFSAIFLALFSACVQAPLSVVTREEQKKQELALGSEIAQTLELNLKKWQGKGEKDIEVYLRTMAQGLVRTIPEEADSPIGVILIEDIEGKWKSFALPGNRIYLAVESVRMVQFENELAALIALELANIELKNLIKRVRESSPMNQGLVVAPTGNTSYFGTVGLLSFSDAAQCEAAKKAVGILYRAGYDARGLVSVLAKIQKHPSTSPYDSDTIERMIGQSRRAIAEMAPLRNPIVKSEGFLIMQKRLKK